MFYEKIRLNFIHLVEGCGHPAPRLIEITKPCVSILVENQIKKGNSKISPTLPNEGNTFDRSKVLYLSRVSIRNIHAGICGGASAHTRHINRMQRMRMRASRKIDIDGKILCTVTVALIGIF